MLKPSKRNDRYNNVLINSKASKAFNRKFTRNHMKGATVFRLKMKENYRFHHKWKIIFVPIKRIKNLSHLKNRLKNKSDIKTTISHNENCDLKIALFDSINKLPVMHRDVFLMKNIHNYKTEHICEELGITKTIFWKIIYEARLQLINELADKRLIK